MYNMWKYVTVVDLINKLTGQQLKNIKRGEKSKLRKNGSQKSCQPDAEWVGHTKWIRSKSHNSQGST